MSCVVVIPSRMASTRFPGKPLCDLLGKPMIQWVVEAVREADITPDVIVATPDEEIIQACRKFGCEAILTSDIHPTGTDRIAEVARSIEADVYVNVQGDEPLISAKTIRAAASPLITDSSVAMGSAYAICPESEVTNPSVVKVVMDHASNALYFSRWAIPYARNPRVQPVYKHIGIYAFRKDVLFEFAEWAPSPLEETESLEQLRFLENGIKIRMSEGEASALAVDTPEQADAVRELLKSRI
jgi:3-deoxy-manno-octulosonate cytidylyltransferase (CMP-KDO synthetase)